MAVIITTEASYDALLAQVVDEITRLRATLTERDAEIERLNRLVYAPGLWRCAKCRFQLVQQNLNAHTGTVTMRDDTGDKCPNCASPLWRVSERESARELGETAERFWSETQDLKAEIAALKAEREWRPIESAPRDGTRVLVYAPPPDPAKWHGSTLGSLICAVKYHADGGWCVCEIRKATHWQPLPPAPEAT